MINDNDNSLSFFLSILKCNFVFNTFSLIYFIINSIAINTKIIGNILFKKLKTNNSYRTIPVSASVIEILKEYKANYPISITGRLINIKSSNSYSNVLIKIYRRMGYDISVHELRHTYTTNLIANGIDFKTAAMLIGDTVDMVMKVYSHVNKDMMNKARDIINNF